MSGEGFAFGPFQFDARQRRLTRGDEVIALTSRQCDLLRILLTRAGAVLSKDELIAAAWPDVAVTDNSLEQAISGLRRMLTAGDGARYIETHARRGYSFAQPVARIETRASDAALDALLAPHRAWIEGRAALETLDRDQIGRAREAFERVLGLVPEQASVHVGLANAWVMQFETTRADAEPDSSALQRAEHHAREACRLDPEYGEAWATLGFVLERTGQRADALAAARRAVTLEPDNWRHHLRLSYGSWGEERLRAAHRTLTLLPGFPLAHWLAATVHVARQAFDEAERELAAGLAHHDADGASRSRFPGVALHWLAGLLAFARGDAARALAEFEREIAEEPSGHLYARECCANTWYAAGAVHLAGGDRDAARTAFARSRERVAGHVLAGVGLSAIDGTLRVEAPMPATSDGVIGRAAELTLLNRAPEAADLLDRALAVAPPGSAGWLLPVEPLLRTSAAPAVWSAPLRRVRSRAV